MTPLPWKGGRPVASAIATALALTIAGCGGGDAAAPAQAQETTQAAATAATQAASAPAPLPQLADWPKLGSAFPKEPDIEARVDALLGQMTLEEKVGQMTQAEIQYVTPAEVLQYHLGSVLNGGGSWPGGDKGAPVQAWLDMADGLWTAAMSDRLHIPLLWGTDAVHGHNNVKGATMFPQNIGLGAMRDPELMGRIGKVTALEVARTGIDWAFGPTVAVVRDDRWGRTYEGYSEDPEVQQSYAGRVVTGMQGRLRKDAAVNQKVIATAKHFLGDGGTTNGTDQGVTVATEAQLINIHGRGYYSAIQAGVQAIMVSYSSWQDAAQGPDAKALKMHGNQYLLTDVLKNKMGFDGIVVTDWNGIGQVKTTNSSSPRDCTTNDCPQAINAGVDMVMAPTRADWIPFIANTIASVKAGEIPMSRIDDAVRRILRVKLRMGLMDRPKPSLRNASHAIGTPEDRAVAREAVRKSIVLLKNNGSALPIARGAKILVAGKSADSLANQAGGWSITWQGGNANADFGGGTTLWGAVQKVAPQAVLDPSPDAKLADPSVDVAIVAIGETPYAEGAGDIGPSKTLELAKLHPEDVALLNALRAKGVKRIVTVLYSGRPLYVDQELNRSDAFVAAFLPGTEGDGLADVLFQKAGGGTNFDFNGKLSYSWPRSACQTSQDRFAPDYSPLYAYGYGLTYASHVVQGQYDETSATHGCGQSDPGSATQPLAIFDRTNQGNWQMQVGASSNWDVPVALSTASTTTTPGGEISAVPVDDQNGIQWAALLVTWNNAYGEFFSQDAANSKVDLSAYAGTAGSLAFDIKVLQAPTDAVNLRLDCNYPCRGQADATAAVKALGVGTWGTLSVSLDCLAERGADLGIINRPFLMSSSGRFQAAIANIRWEPNKPGNVSCTSPKVPLDADADVYVDGVSNTDLFDPPRVWTSGGSGTATLDTQFVAEDGRKVLDVRIANQLETGGNAGFAIDAKAGTQLDVSAMAATGGVEYDVRVLDYGGMTQGFWTKLVCNSAPDSCRTGDLKDLIGRPPLGTWLHVKLPYSDPSYAANGWDPGKLTSGVEVLPAWGDQAGSIHYQLRDIRVKKNLH
ncbi:MAG TPA: glycoside hydrolase family 3 N-terminal domain-containing protein [Burkholderiaceae bacterium]